MENVILIAIGSAFFAAIANLLARTLLKDIKAKDLLGLNFLMMGAMLVLLSPLFYYFEATYLSVGLLLLIAIIDTLANFFYFKTFEKTEVSIATPILSIAPAFTFLFGWLIIDDITNLRNTLIAFAIIILIVIFSAEFKDVRSVKKFGKHTLAPALIASFLFGVSAIPAKILLGEMAVINAPTLYLFRAGYIALFSLFLIRFTLSGFSLGQYRMVFTRGLFVLAQWLLLYYALSLGNAGIVMTLSSITPVFVLILGVLFLKESLTLKKGFVAALVMGLILFIQY